jgi:hypothetical protein
MVLDAVFPPAPGGEAYAQLGMVSDLNLSCATALDVSLRTNYATGGGVSIFVQSGAPDWVWYDIYTPFPTDPGWSTITLDLASAPATLDLNSIRYFGVHIVILDNPSEVVVQMDVDSVVLR